MSKELLQQALDSLKDFASGWAYIRDSHGDLYGVGWDRAQEKGRKAIDALQATIAQPDSTGVSYADFKESVVLMLAAVGYTEAYARQWPKEKVSITFKRWFDEQIENAKTIAQPVPTKKAPE